MWQRRTFYECASELEVISRNFRDAHTDKFGRGGAECQKVMVSTSQQGIEVLRVLALSIRSEQDVGLTSHASTRVGSILRNTDDQKVSFILSSYSPPYSEIEGFRSLGLRRALNCIAHADPYKCGFFANESTHDLIISGSDHGKLWVAIFSLIDLCRVIQSLPDEATES